MSWFSGLLLSFVTTLQDDTKQCDVLVHATADLAVSVVFSIMIVGVMFAVPLSKVIGLAIGIPAATLVANTSQLLLSFVIIL
jgi:hypothetical protein